MKSNLPRAALTLEEVGTVSPALEKYTQRSIGELWKRPDLSPRDRSIVTVAALIARIRRSECCIISTLRSTTA
jgi:4-carboxymuconolactone decarboxylase